MNEKRLLDKHDSNEKRALNPLTLPTPQEDGEHVFAFFLTFIIRYRCKLEVGILV